MKNRQKAKFFCENCGSEVPENAKVCKTCGKFFIYVRCPNCGATGAQSDFSGGCPNCGYAVNKQQGASSAGNRKRQKNQRGKKSRSQYGFNTVFSSGKSGYVQNEESSLPLWVYIVTVSVLVVVLFAIYSCI